LDSIRNNDFEFTEQYFNTLNDKKHIRNEVPEYAVLSTDGKGLRFGGDLLILASRILFQLFTQIFPFLNHKLLNAEEGLISDIRVLMSQELHN